MNRTSTKIGNNIQQNPRYVDATGPHALRVHRLLCRVGVGLDPFPARREHAAAAAGGVFQQRSSQGQREAVALAFWVL